MEKNLEESPEKAGEGEERKETSLFECLFVFVPGPDAKFFLRMFQFLRKVVVENIFCK